MPLYPRPAPEYEAGLTNDPEGFSMNKYPSTANLDDKYKAARLSRSIKPKSLYCHNCEKHKPHYPNRSGVNGSLFACAKCGTERTL